MDGLKLIRKQEEQDNRINEVTDEVTRARNSVQANYPTLKARLDAIDTNADNIQNNINQIVSGLQWKASVPSFQNIAATYPNPQEGWTVSVDDTNIVYRYDEVTGQWQPISSNSIGNVTPNGASGLMTGADKAKLDQLNHNDYLLKTGGVITGQLTVNNGITGNLAGNAETASKLETAVNINGVAFDGSTDIVISDNTKLPLTGGQINGNLTVTGNITGNLTGNATTATALQTPREIKIGNSIKNFDGSNNIEFTLQDIGAADTNHLHDNRYLQLTGGTVTGAINANGGVIGDLTGNADTASGLKNPVNINNVPFDGTQNINVLDNTKLPLTGGTITGQLTVNNGITGNLTGNSTTATRLQTARKINGVDFDGTRDINVGVNTSTTTLGGYVKPNQGGAITPNDTLNQAFGKIEVNLDNKANINHTHTSNNITALTGYTKGNTTSPLNANDSLNTALSKLEVGLDGKANSTHTHNYAGSNTAGGAANSAVQLQNARTIQLTGAVTGQANFDGSQNIQINTTLANPLQNRLVRQRNSVTVNATTNTVNIGIPAYNVNDNILNVYLSGVRLDPVVDYTNTQTQVILTGNKQFINGDVVSFEVIQLA